MLFFSKYSGLGNDFIFINNLEYDVNLSPKEIRGLCHRKLGVGADGVVFLEPSSKADFKMRIHNADGHEAEMCGNALRCVYLFIQKTQNKEGPFFIETYDRVLKIEKVKGQILCEMGQVKDICLDMKIHLANQVFAGHFLNTGVPHLIIFTENVESIDVASLGRILCMHPDFAPHKTNVNFVESSPKGLKVRTYERGVFEETLACGTGACASAVAYGLKHLKKGPIDVITKLGTVLKFNFDICEGRVNNLKMLGSATHHFDGQIALEKVVK